MAVKVTRLRPRISDDSCRHTHPRPSPFLSRSNLCTPFPHSYIHLPNTILTPPSFDILHFFSVPKYVVPESFSWRSKPRFFACCTPFNLDCHSSDPSSTAFGALLPLMHVAWVIDVISGNGNGRAYGPTLLTIVIIHALIMRYQHFLASFTSKIVSRSSNPSLGYEPFPSPCLCSCLGSCVSISRWAPIRGAQDSAAVVSHGFHLLYHQRRGSPQL